MMPAALRRGKAGLPAPDALAAALLPAALTLALCLDGIGRRRLWRDEHVTWWAARLSLRQLGRMVQETDVVLLPYYLGMRLWTGLFGDSPTALRLPSAIAMAVAAGALGLLGRQLFSTRAGLLAGLCFALLPAVSRYGQEARPYAFAMAGVTVSTLLLHRALARPSFRGWLRYAAGLPLLGWTHLVTLLLLPAHLVPVLRAGLGGRGRVARWAFAASAAFGLSAVLPLAIAASSQSEQIAWNRLRPADLPRFPPMLLLSWPVAKPAAALALLGSLLLGVLLLRRHRTMLVTWALLPPLVTLATADRLHLFLDRYLLFTLPAWVLLGSAALCRTTGPLRRLPRHALPVAAALAAVALAWPARPLVHRDLAGEPDYRAVARVLTGQLRPGDALVSGDQLVEPVSLEYELRGLPRWPAPVLLARTPRGNTAPTGPACTEPAPCLAGSARVWLISTARGGDPFAVLAAERRAALTREFRTERIHALPEVTLVLLVRNG